LSDILEETDRTGIKYVVLRIRRGRNPDVGAIEHLERFLHDAGKRHVTVLLAGLRPDFVKILNNVGIYRRLPSECMFPEEDRAFSATLRAVRYAQQLAGEGAEGANPALSGEGEEVYYLV
jgi:SulP family sulfate permease